MKMRTVLNYKEGKNCWFEGDTNNFAGVYELGEVTLTVSKTIIPGEYELNFVPESDAALDRLEIDFTFDTDDVLFFEAGLHTNSLARVCTGKDTFLSRDVFMAKGPDYLLNICFTSAERFYTVFEYREGILKVIYDLEGKNVRKGANYRLESILFNETLDALDFYDCYVQILCSRNNIPAPKPIPAGWSSWSCLYGDINEETILKQSEFLMETYKDRGAEIVQMDDGWQKELGFSDYWTEETSRFPSLRHLCDGLHRLGCRFGLWVAPGLIQKHSTRFDEMRDKINTVEGELVPSFDEVYPLKLDDPDVMTEIRSVFERAVKEYGVTYFKIDFPVNLIMRAGFGAYPVHYESDYSIALYRKFVKMIRQTVGPDVFLLACGSPLAESVGYYDAIRATPDVSWGGFGEDWHPDPWTIISSNISTMMRRAPLHGKLYQNDPDGLILRDYYTEHCDDGVRLTYDEAEMLTIACAFCGGALLLNEEIDRLSEERKALFADIIPPLGRAARPMDFWNRPYPMRAKLEIGNHSVKTEFRIFYNYGEEPLDCTLPSDGQYIAVDARTKKIVYSGNEAFGFTLEPHSARVLWVKSVTGAPMFLYSDENIYMGAGTCADVVVKDTVFAEIHSTLHGNAYFFVPSGSECKISLNGCIKDQLILPQEEISGGRVYRIAY